MERYKGPEEFVIDRKTGQIRQAGSSTPEGNFIKDFRTAAERSLYVFAKGVLGMSRLNRSLHREMCLWLTKCPPQRKLLLMPRDHLKTSMVGRALPIHILIQPKEHNIYQPGKDGASTRILLANETATNAEHQLRWIQARFETNDIMRALWPHRCWDQPRRDSRKWSEKEMIIPREVDSPEGSIETIGVGGAVVGRHYDVLIKDDLISMDAANSAIVMHTAIEWHLASRALMDHPDESLEFTIGTRWAVHDLYSEIMDNDPSVQYIVRRAFEDSKPIMPEIFNTNALNQLLKELGPRFYLLYMNEATAGELVDFDMDLVRYYKIFGTQQISFKEDGRDLELDEPDFKDAPLVPPTASGPMRLNKDTYDMIFSRNQFLRRVRS